ncbi:MAG: DUF1800 domain-containing protein [Planctomycetota bacterium]|nr:DUF1800 domain-containing protein [Planctomycetota bacterium]
MPKLLEGPRAIGHLLRRAGFGPDSASWETYAGRTDYDAVVDELLAALDTKPEPDPDGFDPFVPGAIQQLWLERMVSGRNALAEKLALFWHGHFATSNTKVKDAALMWAQYKLFRGAGGGRFEDLVLGVSRDVAMIRWLDGNANRKGHANENYARELQELFTLGIGEYTEEDIREIARAFTGWGSRHHEFVFREHFHDKGEKTFHGETGAFGGEDVVKILVGLPACPRFLARKLLAWFSHPEPTKDEVEAVAEAFRAADGDIKTTLGAIFRSETFRSPKSYRALVKGPVEFCVGALRAAGRSTVPAWIHGGLDRMGQILFQPPSVKGWTSGTGWLSSGAVVERLRIAQRVAAGATTDATSRVIDLAFQNDVPDPLKTTLETVSGKKRITVALGSPEFQLA